MGEVDTILKCCKRKEGKSTTNGDTSAPLSASSGQGPNLAKTSMALNLAHINTNTIRYSSPCTLFNHLRSHPIPCGSPSPSRQRSQRLSRFSKILGIAVGTLEAEAEAEAEAEHR
jgi:hypothetical protein